MLKGIRKRAKIILIATACIVIPAFIFWGPGTSSRSSRRKKQAGVIFGRGVSIEDYGGSYGWCIRQAILRYGKENFHRIKNRLNLRQKAWERLILLHEAKRRYIKVSDREVIEEIKNYPSFQEDGVFDKKTYELILQYVIEIGASEFEDAIRKDLIISKLIRSVASEVTIGEEEVREEYKLQNEKVKFSYVVIDPEALIDKGKVALKEAKEYYQQHTEEFREEKKVDVEYLFLSLAETKEKTSVSADEIKEYYVEFKERFKKEDKEEYESLDEAKDRIKETIAAKKAQVALSGIAEDISFALMDSLDLAKIGKDFKLSAKETGFFGVNEAVPEIGWSYPFTKKAFALEEGEISEIVKTAQGYYLLKLKAKRPSHIPEFEGCKEEVISVVARNKAWEEAREKAKGYADKIRQFVKNGKDFKAACQDLSLETSDTGPLTRYEYASGLGPMKELEGVVFVLKVGQIGGSVKVSKGYCILKLNEFIPIEEAKFQKEKEKFREELLNTKGLEHYARWLQMLLKEAGLESYLSKEG